ncbi:hypothetical protein AB0E75_28710 [Streptomyces griseoviridis]|uniref:Uncharacterized protein n=1 Tax=Streptomyces griseoviridis TaxID=45398 RepID=A0A918GP64_STRGD|nr:hypothetical protein [Streptomyces niveoruber]GGS50370.1 hypothetical protein GCM10010238_44860 [Streptomyces niveoruber]
MRNKHYRAFGAALFVALGIVLLSAPGAAAATPSASAVTVSVNRCIII